jgi:hypothetical protein
LTIFWEYVSSFFLFLGGRLIVGFLWAEKEVNSDFTRFWWWITDAFGAYNDSLFVGESVQVHSENVNFL